MIIKFGKGKIRMRTTKHDGKGYIAYREEVEERVIGAKEPTEFKCMDDVLNDSDVTFEFENKESVIAVIDELCDLVEFAFEIS